MFSTSFYDSDEYKAPDDWQDRAIESSIQLLGEFKLESSENIKKLKQQPDNSMTVKRALIELKNSNLLNQKMFDAIMFQPQFAYDVSLGIVLLQQVNILSAEILTILTQAGKSAQHFGLIFSRLHKAGIFTSHNRNWVVQEIKHALDISNVLATFDGHLNQAVFSKIMQNLQFIVDASSIFRTLNGLGISTSANKLKLLDHFQQFSIIDSVLSQLMHAELMSNSVQAQRNFDGLMSYAEYVAQIKEAFDNVQLKTQAAFDQILLQQQKKIEHTFLCGTHSQTSSIYQFFGNESKLAATSLAGKNMLQSIVKFSRRG